MLKPALPPVHDEFAALRAADGEALRAARALALRGWGQARALAREGAARTRGFGAQLVADAAPALAAWRAFRERAAPYGLGLALGLGVASAAAAPALIAASALALLTPRASPPAPTPAPVEEIEVLPEGVTLLDRFRRIDETRWVVSDGWHNGAWTLSDWRRSALALTPRGLAIAVSPNPPGAEKPFAGGELQSREVYQYGYFEVRMRVPRGEGMVAALFTYTQPQGRASWQEIDIEIAGNATRQAEFTVHRAGRARGARVPLGFDAADDFHTYGFEWTPDRVRWYVDNALAHEARVVLDAPQRLYLSLWASAQREWTGRVNPADAPWLLEVACVAQAETYRGESLCAAQGDSLRGR